MCSSKPKIPSNKTPVAPPTPEPGPGNLTIGNEREQLARSRGLTIPDRPDLSGLGNQDMGNPIKRLTIDPGSRTPIDEDVRAAEQAAEAARQARAAAYRSTGAMAGTRGGLVNRTPTRR